MAENRSNNIPSTHRELIQEFIDGTLNPIELPRVNALLRECPLLREFYIRQVRTDDLLTTHFSQPDSSGLLRRPAPIISKRKHATAIILSLTIGMAAAIMLMLTVKKNSFNTATPPTDDALYSQFLPAPDRTPIAQVSGVKDVVWSRASGDLKPGHWLSAGKIELEEGMLELCYDSGSTVLIKAPTTYYIESGNKGYLENGSIRAHSPSTVSALYIDTPNSELIDLGTTFGVTVLNARSTEVHVIDGLVKARAIFDDEEVWNHLLGGKALRISSTDEAAPVYKPMKADANLYDWAPPKPLKRTKPMHYAHWSFDGIKTRQFPDAGNHPDGKSYPASIVNFSGQSANSFLIDGRHSNALSLNGQESFLSTNYPAIGGNTPRTVAFWIRLEVKNSKTPGLPGIVCWGKNYKRGAKWQIRAFTPLKETTKKVIRTECAYGHNMGSTDINDGQWHHVASVFVGGRDADIASHVKHYIDGKLESRSSMISSRVDTATTKESKVNFPLTIGLSMENAHAPSLDGLIDRRTRAKINLKTFKGDIDELYIFDDALTPDEIIDLMTYNRVP